MLRGAHARYSRAIKEFENTGRAQLGSQPVKDIATVHEKATEVAVLVAAICHDAGSWTSAVKWANLARTHFTSYYALSVIRAQNGLMLNRIGHAASTALVGIAGIGGLGGVLLVGGGMVAVHRHLDQRMENHLGVVHRLETERDALRHYGSSS